MPQVAYRNLWGSQNSNIDQQRADLFKFQINLPAILGGVAGWSNFVEFATHKFPFPERKREVIAIKYLNQTNFQLGADAPLGAIEIPVRYAFNQATAGVLEAWHQMTSNPRTGGVAQTSLIKTNGEFTWLIPNQAAQEQLSQINSSPDAMQVGLRYILEGCLITGLTPGGADMSATGDGALVSLNMTLQVDRYYPADLNNMVVGSTPV